MENRDFKNELGEQENRLPEPSNMDQATVSGFGDEWSRFTQKELKPEELKQLFEQYFSVFPWDLVHREQSIGVDVGCGSGRWAKLVAPKVKKLFLIDASAEALEVARMNLSDSKNVEFHVASVDAMPFEDESLDFAYSLGVLHHLPDTQSAIGSISKKLKTGAPFLVYLYYAFDNRAWWFKWLWKISDLLRLGVCRMPYFSRYIVSQIFAGLIYWPLARMALLMEKLRILPFHWPLSYYRHRSFYTMRTDSLDRFGTKLEKRYTKNQIRNMLESEGFIDIQFSENVPFWCAVGIKGRH